MKEYNNIKIIAVDHGYGNIKTANCIFPTAITGYDSRPVFDGDLLEYEGRFYRIGEGHKSFIAEKVEDEDFRLLTFVAIAKELEFQGIRSASVHLAVGLPIPWRNGSANCFLRVWFPPFPPSRAKLRSWMRKSIWITSTDPCFDPLP